jgi:hypothetical protein
LRPALSQLFNAASIVRISRAGKSMRLASLTAVLLALALLPHAAFGLGADHPNDQPVGGSDKWPEGLRELVNRPERVHGFFVNWQDYFYFAGDGEKLDAFLKTYAKLPDTNRKIVLHPGKPEVQSPWDKAPRNIAADWKLYTTPFTREEFEQAAAKKQPLVPAKFTTELDLWTGGQVDLARLFVILPADISVEAGDDAKDDAKIAKLIERHRQRQAKQTREEKETAVER